MQIVYLLQAGELGPVLIGTATERGFKRKLDSIQAHNHEVLHIRELLDGDERLERHLHVTLGQHHRRGDWYEPTCLADVPPELERVAFDEDEERRRLAMLDMRDILADT